MKKYIRIGFVLILFQSIISCGGVPSIIDKRFTTATNGSVNSYIAKREYQGEDTSGLYVSGSFGIAEHGQFRQVEADEKTVASLDVYQSFTRRRFNFFYGGHASYGSFKFKGEELITNDSAPLIGLNEQQDFYNVGLKGGFNLKISTPRFEFRPIGLKVLFNYEFGSYQDKLSGLEDTQESTTFFLDYRIFNSKGFFTTLLENEVVYKIDTNNSTSLSLFYGVNLIDEDALTGPIPVAGFMGSYRYKRIIISYIYESTANGSEQDENRTIRSHKLGLAYRLF